MAAIAFVAPIPPGKTEALKKVFQEAQGARGKDLDASRRRLKMTKDQAWVQKTPMGDMVIVYLEGDDPVKGNQAFAASKDPFDVWFKQQVGGILGLDLNQSVPQVEMVLNYQKK